MVLLYNNAGLLYFSILSLYTEAKVNRYIHYLNKSFSMPMKILWGMSNGLFFCYQSSVPEASLIAVLRNSN